MLGVYCETEWYEEVPGDGYLPRPHDDKRGIIAIGEKGIYTGFHVCRAKSSPITSRHPVRLKVHHHVDDIRTQLDEPPLDLFRNVMTIPDG